MKHNRTVLALGFFDGVHKGHLQLIRKTLAIAEETGLEPGLMTFLEHPLTRIFPRYMPEMLTDNTEKQHLIRQAGIHSIFLEDFDDQLMTLSPESFIQTILLGKYHVGHVVVGFNYTFGYQGAGTVDDLKRYGEKYGFGVSVIPPFVLNGKTVSSTVIREMIRLGQVASVEAFLGRPYTLDGLIVHGKSLGHQYGVPTANMIPDPKKVMPAFGVYYTQVRLGHHTYDGLTNVGYNPTFTNHPFTVETYIYDFDEMVYDVPMSVTFRVRERGEVKFNGLEDLFSRIKRDISKADQDYRKEQKPFVDAL